MYHPTSITPRTVSFAPWIILQVFAAWTKHGDQKSQQYDDCYHREREHQNFPNTKSTLLVKAVTLIARIISFTNGKCCFTIKNLHFGLCCWKYELTNKCIRKAESLKGKSVIFVSLWNMITRHGVTKVSVTAPGRRRARVVWAMTSVIKNTTCGHCQPNPDHQFDSVFGIHIVKQYKFLVADFVISPVALYDKNSGNSRNMTVSSQQLGDKFCFSQSNYGYGHS